MIGRPEVAFPVAADARSEGETAAAGGSGGAFAVAEAAHSLLAGTLETRAGVAIGAAGVASRL